MQIPSKFVSAKGFQAVSNTRTEVIEYGEVTQVAKRGTPQKWSVDLTTRLKLEDDIREINAFLDVLDGRYGTFELPCPLKWRSALSTFQTRNAAAEGTDTIRVDGFPANRVNAVVAGEFIKFNNHDKVYKIVFSSNADASGNVDFQIFPKLRVWVDNNTSINPAIFKLRLLTDKNVLSLNASKYRDNFLIQAEEA